MKVRGLCLLLAFVLAGTHPALSNGVQGRLAVTLEEHRPLAEQRRIPLILRLADADGNVPVQLAQGRVRIFMTDPAFSDFQVIDPVPVDSGGRYAFTVTPQTPCGYKLWAILESPDAPWWTSAQDLPGAQKCEASPTEDFGLEAKTDSYRFRLNFPVQSPPTGEETQARLFVQSLGGRYIDDLEPLEAGFGELLGFYEEGDAAIQIPALPDPLTDGKERGGPTVRFAFTPFQPGMLILVSHVRIKGADVFVPFRVRIDFPE